MAPSASREADDFHGTIGGYSNQKCRCPLCTGAWNAYIREYKRRKFAGKDCKNKCGRKANSADGTGYCHPCSVERRASGSNNGRT